MANNDYNQNIDASNETEKMRHSFAHILAQAVLRNYPDAKLGIGPAIENGFYYEFEIGEIVDKDVLLPIIEKEMHKIIEEELPIVQTLISRDEAFIMLHQQGQIYKTELLQEISDEEISFFKTGEEFIDMCRGPHVSSTGKLGAFALTDIKKVYWRDDENRPQLYQIYGVAFQTQEELDKYLKKENAKQEKEHRVLGPRRDLFSFQEGTGQGLPIWMEEGTKIRQYIIDYIKQERLKRDFHEVSTPNIAKVELFKETGHFEFYQDLNIRPFAMDNDLYMLRPMATPSHIEVFRSRRRGYTNLPLRIFEFARLYREEPRRTLDGMVRTREFTQDTAHIFLDESQVLDEILLLLNQIQQVLRTFGFKDYRLQFSRRDPKKKQDYLGNEKQWEKSEKLLVKALEESRMVAREAVGEADFYGPKIDFLVKDIFGKEWQLSTIQVDCIIPSRCKLEFTSKNNKPITPMMIHYSAIGSLERFLALLLEHYSGALPVWLAPVQIIVLPVSKDFEQYAKETHKKLLNQGVRIDIDLRQVTLQNKIRTSQLKEIPFMMIVGKQEQASNVVSIRPRNGEDWGIMTIEEFKEKFDQELVNS